MLNMFEALQALWHDSCSVIIKKSLELRGLTSPLLRFMKFVTIDRENHAKAMAAMQKAAQMVIEDKVWVALGLYPNPILSR